MTISLPYQGAALLNTASRTAHHLNALSQWVTNAMPLHTEVNIVLPADTALSYLALAGATCMIYDHLTTLDIEIEVVWNRPKWQIPQFLFFLNRYVGLILQITFAGAFSTGLPLYIDHFWCTIRDIQILGYVDLGDTFNLVIGSLAAVTFFAVHGIMVYRVSSMYTHDQKILRILVTAYATELICLIIMQLVARIYGSDTADSDIFIQTPVEFCAKEKYTSWVFVLWIPVVLFESLICGLALALGIKYYREVGSHRIFSGYRNSNRKKPLLYILLRDSIIFPFIFSFFCIFNLLVAWLNTTGLKHVVAHASFILPVVSSVIFGSRLILNLRESYYESYDQEFSIRVVTSMDPEDNRISLDLPTAISDLHLATRPTLEP
ncbi:hypothetical protein BJ912DRAFT_932756 [Pholiota molesta]|nr:hypothetical protein BJ912DRAFT_932756 [Pholiota molesta]